MPSLTSSPLSTGWTTIAHPGWGKDSRQARAIAILLRDHVRSDKLGETCKRAQFGFREECETFLRTVLKQNPHRDVQGQACLGLALFLHGRLNRIDLLKEPDTSSIHCVVNVSSRLQLIQNKQAQ